MVGIICGLILPRLLLHRFGSAYNGIVASITQFLSCATLLRAGLGGVTRVALYKPLARKNWDEVSEVVNATQKFMRKVSYIFFALLFFFAFVYPFIVMDQFEWLFSFGLVLILGISTIFECYFGVAYQFLLQADQKRYVISITRICAVVLNTVIAAVLIKLNCTIYEVKLGSALVYSIQPLSIYLYVNHHYPLKRENNPTTTVIAQRWDAFAHQVSSFVTTNTDIIVLTIFSDIKTVSIYSVYNMVVSPIKNLIVSAANGTEAAFGNMLAQNEMDVLRRRFTQFEFLTFLVTTGLFVCTAALISPFIWVYTSGVEDVNYWQPTFGLLMCIAQYFACIRLPYQTIVEAAGYFRETRNGAILEAILNIGISIPMVCIIGLNGVVIGTVVSLAFRTTQYASFVDKRVMKGTLFSYIRGLVFSVSSAVGTLWVSRVILGNGMISNFGRWIVHGLCIAGITAVVMLVASTVMYPKQAISTFRKFCNRHPQHGVRRKDEKNIKLDGSCRENDPRH